VSRLVVLYAAGAAVLAALVALAAADPWAANGGADATGSIIAGDVAGAITFELRQRKGSGQFGFVTLEPRGAGTRVAVELLPPATVRASVREGTCARPGRRLHDLGVVTRRATDDVAATALVTVDSAPDELRSGSRLVTLERNAAVTACAAIGD
jgi:hypothetical protein